MHVSEQVCTENSAQFRGHQLGHSSKRKGPYVVGKEM